MKTMIKIIIVTTAAMFLTGCDEFETTSTQQDVSNTIEIANSLVENQPTPTDINYSLERYNLIKRAYWVNGQREKANSLVCAIEKPLGYIVLITESGAVVGNFVVDGKVSSLNSFLTPDSEYYEKKLDYGSGISDATTLAEKYSNKWLADVDGSYGENDNGIFFFTPDGKYIEWTGAYLYSDIPFIVENPVVRIGD
ncbi:hypothetical protein [Lacrimispora sp.]|uniref:hypothetical protein n=1 Tax=Lacrimispora sp. TaxID=2719234 RepID=UPI0028AEE5C6|nr:hypothetical protein [Lacrimispora sp.]